MAGPVNIDWALIRKQLPCEKTPEQKAQVDHLWQLIDLNQNGYVSLAELDKALRETLYCYQVFECKPVIIAAFSLVKDVVGYKKSHGDYYIDQSEFRLVLLYLRQYFEYFKAFSRVDINDDQRISLQNFMEQKHIIEKWIGSIKNPETSFKQIDKHGKGYILFDDLCDWAIKKNFDVENDDD